MKRGFTLLECICVCFIVAVLASILAPIVQQSMIRARQGSAIVRLQTLHHALMLYQSDYGGGGTYGTAEQMGLPSEKLQTGLYLTVVSDRNMWKSPCGTHPDRKALIDKSKDPLQPDYVYYPQSIYSDIDNQLSTYYQEYREDGILLSDTNCFDHALPLFAGIYRRNIIGLHLDGHVDQRWTYQFPDLYSNWK